METTYYTVTAREIVVTGDGVEQAVGGGRRMVCTRRAGQPRQTQPRDNVIDLSAWKRDREEEARLEQAWYAGVDEALQGPAVPPLARPRRERGSRVLFWGELLATVCLIGTLALLMARMLTT